MSGIADGITALSNFLLAAAAIAGAVIAAMGLNTWKNQNIWTADAELARKALLTIYRYRDSLYSIRHPAMFISEMQLDEEEASQLRDEEKRRQGVIDAYAKRWEKHTSARQDLDAVLVEADVVWGNELSELAAVLKQLEHELYTYVMLHLDAHYRGDTNLAEDYRKIIKDRRDILYDHLNDEDIFRRDFTTAMRPIEKLLRSMLGRKSGR
ncbi:hypothetical protein [Vannielia sp.]|uniref:hypothetical protein n=1 Tax=Vannielia sp. TaxID=2813045 RepID=UPI0026032FFC|nr:hypothetical protein [Vannielia sp.]MDF1873718.1 hypothetical protein [Vannielia sp.]